MSPTQPDVTKQLLEEFKEDLKTLIRTRVTKSADNERTAQYRIVRRNHLYFEGKQNLAPGWLVPGELADWIPVANTPGYEEDSETAQRRYDTVFNFIRSDTTKAVAVTGQCPTVKAVADDPDSPDSIQAAKDADAVGQACLRRWNADQIQEEIMFTFRIYGPAFLYVRWVADAEKNGTVSVPITEVVESDLPGTAGYDCINCGRFMPQDVPAPDMVTCVSCGYQIRPDAWKPAVTVPMTEVTGQETYANGFPEIAVENTMTVMVPSDIKTLEDTPYLHYERDLHPARVLAIHPKLARKLEELDGKKGNGFEASALGADTRAIAHSTDASTAWAKDQWNYALTWLRPAMYAFIKDRQKQEALKQQYPEGLRLTFVCDELVDMTPENLLNVWCAAPPTIGNRLLLDPLCNDDVSLADFYNDTQNLLHQTAQRGIPATVADSGMFDQESFKKRPPAPAEMIFVPLKGGDPNRLMAKLPTATFPAEIVPWIQQVRKDNRDINGITEAIAGAQGGTKTAEEARLQQNAALRQLSVSYNKTRALWCQATELAVKQCAKYGIGRIQSPKRQGVFGQVARVVDTSRLSPDGFHFEADPGMPASFAEERDRILGYLQESPVVADMIGLSNPINAGSMANYLRIPGMVVPGENLREKVRWQIEQLLKAAPIPGPDGQMQPSIMPDHWDPHDVVSGLLYTWCDSAEGIDARESGAPGFQNVLAFADAHKMLAMPPPMPGQPGQPGQPAPPPPDQANSKPKDGEGPSMSPPSAETGLPLTDFTPPGITDAPQPSTIQ